MDLSAQSSAQRFCPTCREWTDDVVCAADGAATLLRTPLDHDKANLHVGDVVAQRYVLTSVLGRGGYAVVYGAEHVGTRQQVAIKMLRADADGPSDADIQRFYREAQITANLRDAHTIRVFDIGETADNALYIAMERLQGPTLEQVLRDCAADGEVLTEKDTLDLGIAVLHSLSEAHSQGVVHRDLKPSNIVLTEVDGKPLIKVLDFGIARQQGSSLTDAGRSLGTPAYMSPEQCRAQPVDGRSDLYSLGIILFRCLAGRLPFREAEPMAMMFCHTSEPPADLSTAARAPVSEGLVACVMRALAKSPSARFASAREMRHALEAVQRGEPIPEVAIDTPRFWRRSETTGFAAPSTESMEGLSLPATPTPLRPSAWPLIAGGAAVAAVLGRRSSAGPRPVYGREEEFDLLGAALDAVGQGRPSGPVVFEAEPGMGKSAIVDGLVHLAQARGIRVLAAVGDAIECATHYHAWRSVFARLLRIDGVTDAPTRRQRVDETLSAMVGCEGLAPLLEAVVPLGLDETPQTAPLKGQTRADRTVALLVALLERSLASGPLVLVLEDLHWFDSASARLALCARDALAGTLVVATTRPVDGEQRRTVDQLCATDTSAHRSLSPLRQPACGQLIADRLGVQVVSPDVVELICTRSMGNPLFAESLALALQDSGALRIEEGRCVLDPSAGDIATAAMQDDLHGVIGSRIDKLSAVAQLTLQAASAVGRSFPVHLLHDIHPAGESRAQLRATLADLVRQGLVAVDPGDATLTMAFSHTILQEVTYNHMLFEQRRDLHRAVAAWYERTFQGELVPYYPLLAHHYGQAGDEVAELTMLQLGAQEALKAGAWREAVGLLQQCLGPRMGAITLQGETEPRALREARWLRQLSDAYDGLGDVERSGSHAQQALVRLGQPQLERGSRLWWHALSQVLHRVTRAWRPAALRIRRGVEGAAALEAARGWQRLGHYHFFANQAPEMVTSVFFCANAAALAGPSADLANAEMSLATLVGMVPIHGLSRRIAAGALAEAEQSGDPATLAWVHMLRGLYRVGVGEWEGCRADLDAAQAICDRISDRRTWGNAQALRTWTHHYRGELGQATACAEALLERARRESNHQHQVWAGRFLAASLAAAGNHDAAIARFETTLVQLREGRDRAEYLTACGSAAASHWAGGRRDLAESLAYEALELASTMDRPTSHVLTEGLAGMTEVFVALWQQEGGTQRGRDAARAARRGLAMLNQSRRIFPVAVPAWLRLKAWIAHIEGRGWLAQRSWHAASEAARHMGLALEEGRVAAALAQARAGLASASAGAGSSAAA